MRELRFSASLQKKTAFDTKFLSVGRAVPPRLFLVHCCFFFDHVPVSNEALTAIISSWVSLVWPNKRVFDLWVRCVCKKVL